MKIKIFLVSTCLIWLSFNVSGQSEKYDSTALMILDRMSAVIGDLESCSYTLLTSHDTVDHKFGMITEFGSHQVYMVGPDKMFVNSRNNKGHRQYHYNGAYIAYYSHDENNYALLPAPNNIMATIDSIHKNYNVQFPAADFFYPTFTDDLIGLSENISLIGRTTINGIDCFQILAVGKEMRIQIWVTDDAFNLPLRFTMSYISKEGIPQYSGTFANWEVNPNLPEAMFEFQAPPGATEIIMLSKNENQH